MLGLAKSSIWLFITIPVWRDMNCMGRSLSLGERKNAGNFKFSLSNSEKLEEAYAVWLSSYWASSPESPFPLSYHRTFFTSLLVIFIFVWREQSAYACKLTGEGEW